MFVIFIFSYFVYMFSFSYFCFFNVWGLMLGSFERCCLSYYSTYLKNGFIIMYVTCLILCWLMLDCFYVPFVQTKELRNSASRLSQHFMDVAFYRASIPTYYGGDMAFGWASDTRILRTVSVAQLQDRFARANIMTQYYSPEVHLTAFAIPPWISKIFQTNNSPTDSA